MTVTVELDVYSGNPNPSWQLSQKEARELVDRVQADLSLMAPMSAETGGLGYRGFIVNVSSDEEDASVAAAGLPAMFRIGGHYDKSRTAELWMLETTQQHDAGVDEELYEVSQEAITNTPFSELIPELGAGEMTPSDAEALCWLSVTSYTNFAFWNQPNYVWRNNCYNFASNYRSNTFAQPGRKTGRNCTAASCFNPTDMSNLTLSDGYRRRCSWLLPNIYICLAIWPGRDYHFYRRCKDGYWCHKPGKTPARNKDNSGRLIRSVADCNRGPYTEMAGYFLGLAPFMIVR